MHCTIVVYTECLNSCFRSLVAWQCVDGTAKIGLQHGACMWSAWTAAVTCKRDGCMWLQQCSTRGCSRCRADRSSRAELSQLKILLNIVDEHRGTLIYR
jgi:hypothetical protein